MKKTVMVALEDRFIYQQLVAALENDESRIELEISQNIESQATFLYFLPKVKPHFAVISENLPGELSVQAIKEKIKELSPETKIIVYSGELYSIIAGILTKPGLLHKIVAIWSPSGGVGKTEIAKNLALTAGTGFRVILVDANLCNPDIAEHLAIKYQRGHTLSTALELWSEDKLTPDTLQNVLLDYGTIRVLVGSDDVLEQSDYSPVFFRDLLKALAQLSDFVIVDMDSDITSPAGISILLASQHVITPYNTTPSTLGHGKVYMDLLKESYQMNPVKFDPILNRVGEGGPISIEDIEICVKRPVIASIPYHKSHLLAASSGKPIVLGKQSLSKQLHKTFQDVVKQYAKEDVKRQ